MKSWGIGEKKKTFFSFLPLQDCLKLIFFKFDILKKKGKIVMLPELNHLACSECYSVCYVCLTTRKLEATEKERVYVGAGASEIMS